MCIGWIEIYNCGQKTSNQDVAKEGTEAGTEKGTEEGTKEGTKEGTEEGTEQSGCLAW